jgi:hypothetical protein
MTVVALIQVGCNSQAPANNIFQGGKTLAVVPATIHYDSATNTCTQNPRIIRLKLGDAINYSTDAPAPATVVVKFPQPDIAAYVAFLPGSPFLAVASPPQWQWAVTGGAGSKPAAVTSRETPNVNDLFYFYYSQILVNGKACVPGDPQGMGVSVQR